jgi:hypothetical protein
MYQVTLKLVLGAVLTVSLLAPYAFAQGRACGPNSVACTVHHEHCKCRGK